jgi:hypothetical protein
LRAADVKEQIRCVTGHGYGRASETVEEFVAKKWYSAEFAWPDKPATLKSHVVEVYHLLEAVAHACLDILVEGLQVSAYSAPQFLNCDFVPGAHLFVSNAV